MAETGGTGKSAEGFWHQQAGKDAARCNYVYADGVFDLFHAGHLAFLRKAKAAGGDGARLIVGVITDEDAQWKRRPFIDHANRVAMLKACNIVDEVVERPPLVVGEAFLKKYEIDFVVHGDDSPQEQFFAVPIKKGIMRYVSYHADISTTMIAERIVAQGAAKK
jgi:cytidyltransferase-like protein